MRSNKQERLYASVSWSDLERGSSMIPVNVEEPEAGTRHGSEPTT